MERVIYLSVAADSTGTSDVFDIIESSKRRNTGREITGFLLHDSDRFLQLIEGPTKQIDWLLADLAKDPRHHSIEYLERTEVADRLFGDWDMKRLITFAGTPAMEEIERTLEGRPEQEHIVQIVKRFIGGGAA